jgi:hypothetical protein
MQRISAFRGKVDRFVSGQVISRVSQALICSLTSHSLPKHLAEYFH